MKIVFLSVLLTFSISVGYTSARVDRCLRPAETGECRAAVSAWFFDTDSCSCKQFNYGGCGDEKGNVFSARELCIRRCQTEVCYLPVEPGPCRAAISRWYYNPDTKKCTELTFGGCHGNENNFKSKRECRRACRRAIRSEENVGNAGGCKVGI